ncbi:catechol-2,3-dioxygenase [Chitinophaga skermanii]|uniref:Catechol-2,3-dioxygenase n=1 Tax=Chitinophaga skermanii TaxID=331697 RepID=A0A327QQ82_9BACT|nr:hypothetical protein [Chitinophaga skermanii]RAJ03937.1 catechol-2,3-dioxygenase [Chitinophaga skermanii]
MEILRLHLHTNRLPQLVTFYESVIGLPVTTSHDGLRAIIQIGSSEIVFEATEESAYYHFAINIPAHLLVQAHDWLQARVTLLPYHNQLIVPFPHWNADALYFHDPAGNIVELIARRDLAYDVPGIFSAQHWMSVSEIGLPVERVDQTNEALQQVGVPVYDGDNEQFSAVGDAHGLFIVVDREQKTWMPTHEPALTFPLEVIFKTMPGGKVFVLRLHQRGIEVAEMQIIT